MGEWLNLRQRLSNDHIFVCHNSNADTWLLRQSGRICDGQTHLVIFLLVLLITFNWIWMKPASFVIRVTWRFLGAKINPPWKNCSDSMFSITVLQVGSAAGVNYPVIFLEKWTKVHPGLKGTNLVTRYGLPEVSYVISNKSAYMDYDLVHTKISPTISFSGMYLKPFIYCRNRTNSQERAWIYLSIWSLWSYVCLQFGISTIGYILDIKT